MNSGWILGCPVNTMGRLLEILFSSFANIAELLGIAVERDRQIGESNPSPTFALWPRGLRRHR